MLMDLYLSILTTSIIFLLYNKLHLSIRQPKGDTVITLGHKFGLPIRLDMKKFPSLSITGVTNSGKSCCVRNIISTTKLQTVVANGYTDDYKDLDCELLNSTKDIIQFLDSHTTPSEEPILLVIDELLSLVADKDISKRLHILLSHNRHLNIYVICIMQEFQKSIVSFKSLFSARVSFRALQNSDYESNLGIGIHGLNLSNREFCLVSDGIYFGKTYNTNMT